MPDHALLPVAPHLADVEGQGTGRDVRQRMGPVLEHRLVDALGLLQVFPPITGDSGEQDMVVAALDDVDGVDLDVAEMCHGGGGRMGPCAEWFHAVEALRTQPQAT